MNKNTVRFNTWVGRVAYSHSYSYTFEAKRSRQSITSHKLECRIVGKSEKDYVLAVLKGSASEVESAKKKYVDGSVWVLAKVKLEENTNAALISTPLKVSVDLKKSAVTVNSTQTSKRNWLSRRCHLARFPKPARSPALDIKICSRWLPKIPNRGRRIAARFGT